MMDIPNNFQEMNNLNISNNEQHKNLTIAARDKISRYIAVVKTINPFIWIVGVFIIATVIFISNAIFLRRIKKCEFIKDRNILNLLDECKILINVDKNICLIRTNHVKTPCVVGFLKPIILIPQKLFEDCDLDHIRYIFLHELAHIRRKDILVNYLVSFLCITYWFNPLVWYGFSKMREEREMCCDSLALSCLRAEEVKTYGFAIIKLAEISSRAPWLPTTAGIINNKSKMKRRISMIKIFKKNSYRLSAAALAALVVAGGVLLTEAKADSVVKTQTESTVNSKGEIEDKIDYPFVNDEEVIGKWETVDFVKDIDKFKVNSKAFGKGKMYLKSMTVLPDGKMAQPVADGIKSDEITPVTWLTWTNGYIMHHNDKTAEKYIIKEIDGAKYMFLEWKSGDYILRHKTPQYYVLKQVQ
jgi:bla regulator protein BlaR1